MDSSAPECCLRGLPPERLRRVISLAPALLLVGSLVIGLLALAWRSLHAYDSFLAIQGGWSFTQYGTVLTDPQFHTVLQRTLLMAVITPIVAVAIGVPYAMTLTCCKRRWVRLLLLIGVFVPLLTGDITRTYGLLVAIGPNGPLDWITSNVGLGSPHLLGTLWAIGIGIVQILLPAAVVVLLPSVLRIDPELGSAAMTSAHRRGQSSCGSRFHSCARESSLLSPPVSPWPWPRSPIPQSLAAA